MSEMKILAEYFLRKKGEQEWEKLGENIVPNEGLATILDVALGAATKPAGIYMALFSGTTAPNASWKADNFPTVASEFVSQTEGYAGATRPQWSPSPAANNVIDNFDTPVEFTMKATTSITVRGAALLTSSERGGTTGKLMSAAKFTQSREFYEGENYQVGYRLSITSG